MNTNTIVNTTFRNGVKKYQVEAKGSLGLWFPMGQDVTFDTKEEAELARLDPENLIYKQGRKRVIDENSLHLYKGINYDNLA